jgi:hypothetical protein
MYLGMCPRLEAHRLDGVIVPAIPLLKVNSSVLLILDIPLEHGLLEVNVGPVTVVLDSRLRVVQHVVGVHDGQVLPVDETTLNEEVKQPHELLVPGLAGHKLIPAGDLVPGRNCAPVVRGNGTTRVTDQEGEVEAAEDVEGEDGRVARLRTSAEGFGDRRVFSVGREEVIGHVLDKNTLTLGIVSNLSVDSSMKPGYGGDLSTYESMILHGFAPPKP